MTPRVFRRPSWRSRRLGIVLAVVAAVFASAAVLVWWRPSGGAIPRLGWSGAEQAGWIAGIVSGVLSLISTVAAVRALSRTATPSPGRRQDHDLVQVGRVPPAAAWLQDRSSHIDLVRAARAGRAAVLTQVLSGMGGVGKTQLAARFARDLAASGELDVLLWVTATGQDAIIAGYAETARALGLADADTDPHVAAQRFAGWLERTGQRWLIVLDNLDTPADATGWWPPDQPNGRTVVTTRRRDAVLHNDHRTMITVGLFTPGEAIAYLTHAVGAPADPAEVSALAAHLGYLPLATAQAAAFIRDRGIDCAAYRNRLTDQRQRLADLTPTDDALPDEHRNTVAATWALSVDAADTSPPRGLARPLLDIAALLDPNDIPTALFTSNAVREHLHRSADAPPAPEDDVQDINDALHNLHRLNLITHDQRTSSVRIHALIQRATRDRLSAERLAAISGTTADALISIWPDIERDPTYAQTLRANTYALRVNTGDGLLVGGAHDVLFTSARSLGNAGLVLAALAAFQRLYQDCLRILGPDHPDTLTIRNDLAHWRGETGDRAAAVTELEQVLADRLRIFGPEHPQTLETRTNIAYWRGKAGDPATAATTLQQVLAEHLRVLGPDHHGTLATRASLARSRGEAGDSAGAATALEQVLADHLRVLGPDHPETLITRGSLAYWRGKAGDPAGAATALEQILADRLRVLGPDHPETMTARHNLAHFRGKAGDPAGAANGQEQVLADRLRVLGPDHPQTLRTRQTIAYWRGQAGDPAGAVTALEQVLTDEVRVLGSDHPNTLNTRINLANCRGEAGDPAGAVADYEQLIEDELRVLGPDHPGTLATRANLARWRATDSSVAGRERP